MKTVPDGLSWTVCVLAMAAAPLVTGCPGEPRAGPVAASAPGGAAAPRCPLREARRVAASAGDAGARWSGPTSGPRAVSGKRIVFVAETMTNPGVAGAAAGVQTAGHSVGWDVRVIDGRGTPAGIEQAFGQAIALRPAGIVIGGFDPHSIAPEVRRARAAGIRLVGWHAVPAPGPAADPDLFTNVTTRVEDVARISAYWIIARSGGKAGVVIFTDASVPFAAHKSHLIRRYLLMCPRVKVLAYQNIAIPDASARIPAAVSSLVARLGHRWTYSAAINDLYFADAAPALRAAGRKGDGTPYGIGAGDGSPAAFERIRDRRYQAATVPEPLRAQGSQIVDEFNRAFSGTPASGYVAPVHLVTGGNVDQATSWDPPGYDAAYRRVWGR